eukprot:jgi/Psemu1/225855/e_gw1.1683.8.1
MATQSINPRAKTKTVDAAAATATEDRREQDRLLVRSWIHHSDADYHDFTQEQADGIRSALLGWYTNERRKLPWRGDPPPFDGSTSGINNGNRNGNRQKTKRGAVKPREAMQAEEITSSSSSKNSVAEEDDQRAIPVTGYGVWVSEIMLQQTRVEAVIPYWIKWMKSFPTVYDLAAATEDEVNAHWAGLGFYRRARYLHQGAKYVVEKLDGELPTTPQELSRITGIGPYTASAIASIAFGVCVPVVDGNVCRVLSRLTGIANHIKHPILKDKLGWKLATQIVEAGDGSSPGLVNQALMELGATYCAPAGSGIDHRDPLKDYYLSTRLGRAYLTVLQDRITPGDNDGDGEGDSFQLSNSGTKHCKLCDPDGIQTILQTFQETIFANITTLEEAAKAGHATFPTDPPKTEKKEEDLAVVVLLNRCGTENSKDDTLVRYLMVKRPKEGLLAGQWEFPNVCIQTRNKKSKNKKKTTTKIPTKAERDRALSKFLLNDLFLDHANNDVVAAVLSASRSANKQPMEHIFSHVKHYMWVEVGQLTDVPLEERDLEWKTPMGKDVRWMSKDDMDGVGITSGVKKVLQAVENSSILNRNVCAVAKTK